MQYRICTPYLCLICAYVWGQDFIPLEYGFHYNFDTAVTIKVDTSVSIIFLGIMRSCVCSRSFYSFVFSI